MRWGSEIGSLGGRGEKKFKNHYCRVCGEGKVCWGVRGNYRCVAGVVGVQVKMREMMWDVVSMGKEIRYIVPRGRRERER